MSDEKASGGSVDYKILEEGWCDGVKRILVEDRTGKYPVRTWYAPVIGPKSKRGGQ